MAAVEPPANIIRECFRGGITPGRAFLQALQGDRFQVAGNLGNEPPGGHRLLSPNLIDCFKLRNTMKRLATCQQLVQDRAGA